MFIDLQLHSTYSDGYLTPTQLVKFMARQEVRVVSLTDHNTVGGLNEFRQTCRQYKIKPITGLELYVKLNNQRFGILWFKFDDKSPELHNILRDSQTRRRNQVRIILQKLLTQGLRMDINKILDKYNHYVPINQVVDDIYALPYNRKKIKKELGVNTPREGEIIMRYFKNSDIGILRESYISINRILKLRKKIGGQIILNHPGKHHQLKRDFLEKLKKLGFDGIELLSPHHSIAAAMYIQFISRELDFINTGGSDFHRFEGSPFTIQNSWQYYKIDSKYLRGIDNIIS
jgi:predicted metal-dependent phosphoesterase TrpH